MTRVFAIAATGVLMIALIAVLRTPEARLPNMVCRPSDPVRALEESAAVHVLYLGNSLVFIVGVTVVVYVMNVHHTWVVKRFRANEETLNQRHKELALARDEAILANKIKDRFLANMSHELRTPLNAILGYSEMIQEELEDEGVEDFTEEFGMIQRSGKSLVNMLHDILELTHFESGEVLMAKERFALQPMLHKLAEMMPRPIEIVSAPEWDEVKICSHLQSVEALLTKLLDNACKFTPEHGHVWLELLPFEREDSVRIICVRDDGPGIDQAHHHTIFEAFAQVDSSSTRQRDGAGLGLALVRHIAHHLDVEAALESAPGEGARFLIKFPAEQFVKS